MTGLGNTAGQVCFEELLLIWDGFNGNQNRVIPFCTPIIERPRGVIVGINHSVFLPGSSPEGDATAEEFSKSVPRRHAFIKEDFYPQRLSEFAEDVLDVFYAAGLEIDTKWIGTNRCPVQRTKIDEIRWLPSFEERQKQTDRALRKFFKAIAPEYIVLVGKFAAELYFSGAESKTYDELKQPKIGQLRAGLDTKILAIEYPNFMHNKGMTNKDRAVKRLKENW